MREIVKRKNEFVEAFQNEDWKTCYSILEPMKGQKGTLREFFDLVWYEIPSKELSKNDPKRKQQGLLLSYVEAYLLANIGRGSFIFELIEQQSTKDQILDNYVHCLRMEQVINFMTTGSRVDGPFEVHDKQY